MEKKTYEAPEVTKVEFDYSERIAADSRYNPIPPYFPPRKPEPRKPEEEELPTPV